jgi:hypothetical protein
MNQLYQYIIKNWNSFAEEHGATLQIPVDKNGITLTIQIEEGDQLLSFTGEDLWPNHLANPNLYEGLPSSVCNSRVVLETKSASLHHLNLYRLSRLMYYWRKVMQKRVLRLQNQHFALEGHLPKEAAFIHNLKKLNSLSPILFIRSKDNIVQVRLKDLLQTQANL